MYINQESAIKNLLKKIKLSVSDIKKYNEDVIPNSIIGRKIREHPDVKRISLTGKVDAKNYPNRAQYSIVFNDKSSIVAWF